MTDGAQKSANPAQLRVGYLTSEYPATSHTFIRREVEQLTKEGLSIKTYSVRKPASPSTNPFDRLAEQQTFYLLGQGAIIHLVSNGLALAGAPVRYFSTLRKALRHRVPGLKALIWALFHFIESMTLARQLQKDDITHLHNHFANSAANVGMLASHFSQIPWSVTLHGISETDYPAGLLLADKVKAAEFVACVSWFGRAQAMRITPVDQWHKFHTVRCGIPMDRLPSSQNKKTGQKPRKIVCVARLSAEKGLPGLLQALISLRADGIDFALSLVGSGPEEAMLREMVAQLDLTNAVTFRGRLAEAETLQEIATADLFILPSFMEGLPVVLMEAMALQVPVIASRIAGIPELVREGETGRLFDPAHWDDLARAIRESVDDPEGARQMAERGRKLIEQEFDIGKATAKLPGLFAGSKSNPAINVNQG